MASPQAGPPGAEMWSAGYKALMDGWQQAQEFWTGVGASWGNMASAWMPGAAAGRAAESMTVMRELNEAAFAVAQAWMRMPLTLMGGARPDELQQAITKLTEAQGRAFQLWMEAVSQMGNLPGAKR